MKSPRRYAPMGGSLAPVRVAGFRWNGWQSSAVYAGKPHPMIEPSLRHERLLQEALDPNVAVIVLDIEIGYGSHDEAGKILAEEVIEARELLAKEGRTVGFFATICGSYDDYQGYDIQKDILESAGISVFETNEQCARAAVAVVTS